MTAYNPQRMTAQQGASNGGAIAALARLQSDAANSLGTNVLKTGQDTRSNNLNDLIGSGALNGMNAAQQEQFMLANAGGSLNEQTNKNTQALLANQQKEEASALANVNQLEQLGITNDARMAETMLTQDRQDGRNAANLLNNVQMSKDKTTSLEKIAKDAEAGRMERHQEWSQLGDGWVYNKKTAEFKRPDGSAISVQEKHKDFFKTLTGNKKDYFADLSDHNKDLFMDISIDNPHLNVDPIFEDDTSGRRQLVGFTLLDGTDKKTQTSKTYTLADAEQARDNARAYQKQVKAQQKEQVKQQKAAEKEVKRVAKLPKRTDRQKKADFKKAKARQDKARKAAIERGRKRREGK